MACYRGEVEYRHPQFPEGSQAASRVSAGPVEASAADIIYSAEDNEAIDAFHRKRGLYIRILLCSIAMFIAFQLGLRIIL